VFRSVAARILRTQKSWKSISLFDPRGQPLAHMTKPLVDAPKGISRQSLDAVLLTRRPFISDFPQVDSPESGVNIHVPVVREQTIIYILTAAIEPQVFTDILLQQKLPPSWVGTVYDSHHITIARTRDAAKYVAKPVGQLLQQTGIERSEQFLSGISAEQIRAYAAISRSHVSNWFVALTVPSAEVNAILYRLTGNPRRRRFVADADWPRRGIDFCAARGLFDRRARRRGSSLGTRRGGGAHRRATGCGIGLTRCGDGARGRTSRGS
jgi:hypothetical protein